MDYNKLIDDKLLRAFKLLKNLSVTLTLIKSESNGFDFNTASVDRDPPSPSTAPAVVLSQKTKDNTVSAEVLARPVEIGPLTALTSVTFNGFTWHVGPASRESGRVVIFTVYRKLNNG